MKLKVYKDKSFEQQIEKHIIVMSIILQKYEMHALCSQTESHSTIFWAVDFFLHMKQIVYNIQNSVPLFILAGKFLFANVKVLSVSSRNHPLFVPSHWPIERSIVFVGEKNGWKIGFYAFTLLISSIFFMDVFRKGSADQSLEVFVFDLRAEISSWSKVFHCINA